MDTVDRIFTLVDQLYPEQQQFARALGVYPSLVSSWRNRKSSSYNRRLPEIATLLGTTTDYLLSGLDEKKPALDEEGRPPGLGQLEQIYCSINLEGQELLLDYAIYLEASGRYIKSNPAQLGQAKDA